jgi:ketosteroid isomerase-like protein
MIKIFLCIVMAWSLVSAELPAQSKKVQSLLAAEQARFEAMEEKDTAALRLLLTEELTYVHSNGLVEGLTEHLQNIVTGRIVYAEMIPVEHQARRYGRVGLITGVVAVNGMYEGKSFEVKLRYTSVYLRRQGRWQLLAWQSVRTE